MYPYQTKPMHELTVNLHIHTFYSDGHATHEEIAQAAIRAGLDAIIATDHNVWVEGPERYYHHDGKNVLLLVGEEVHDQTRDPQKNHLLIFGAQREMAPLAGDTQLLIDCVRDAGGVSFIAHPVDPAAPQFNEPDISWMDWNRHGYQGIELWNAMSEFKSLLKDRWKAIWYAYQPQRIAHGPFPQALQKWDELLSQGLKVAAIGGSDAHALNARMGPLKRTLFPYEFHFRAVNTHLLIPEPLNGDLIHDRGLILEAFRKGHAFIGYDLPSTTRGFRFTAQGKEKTAWMGDEITAKYGVTLQVRLPQPAECHLLKDGVVIKKWRDEYIGTYITTQPGVYRVEVYLFDKGKRRGWIFSNPIYVRP
ncbi:MAG: CehA/McbA family metallohydrolase [Chloroflexota bacterium]